LFVTIRPEKYARDIAWEFGCFLRDNREELEARYKVAPPPKGLLPRVPPFGFPDKLEPKLSWVHNEKLEYMLRLAVLDGGFGQDEGHWIAMQPELASVYATALAEHVARENNLSVVTDQPEVHGILNGWDIGTLTHSLLRDGHYEPSPKTDEIAAMYAAVAIRAIVPGSLADIPVEKIIKARRTLNAEFNVFRDYLSSIENWLAELGQITEIGVLQAELEPKFQHDLLGSASDLERGLRRLGLEPVRAVLGLKSLALPAAAAAATAAAGTCCKAVQQATCSVCRSISRLVA
jgi:hypothetical protein